MEYMIRELNSDYGSWGKASQRIWHKTLNGNNIPNKIWDEPSEGFEDPM